jgi:hypothetical protein
MEPEGSLPYSQQPTICPYPEPDRSSPWSPSNLSKIHFTKSHIPFPFLTSYRRISLIPRLLAISRNMIVFDEEFLAPRPTHNLEDHSLSAIRDCLLNIFAAALHICMPFLHQQPEDAPCRGDRDPGYGKLAGSCECGDEPLGCIKCGKFLV